MDKRLKEEADTLYKELGMNLTTAITIFVKQSVRQRRIPFGIGLENDRGRFNAVSAVERIRENALQNGTAELSINEINAEIKQARAERRARKERE